MPDENTGWSFAGKTHPEYDKALPKWEKCRASVAGEEEIKKGGQTYLPLPGVAMTEPEYDCYKDRANFAGFTERTVEALVGLAFKETPVINTDDWGAVDYLETNVDGAGTTLYEQMKFTTGNVTTVGRGGLVVDYPKAEKNTVAADKNLQAAINFYTAESIINWGTEKVSGKKILQFVVLVELVNDSENKYQIEEAKNYRMLYLNDEGKAMGVVVDKSNQIVEDEYEIKANGTHLDFLPFYLISASGTAIDKVEKPPVLKIANTNLAHYRTDAEMRQCMHYNSNPQPYATGCSSSFIKKYEKTPLVIGTTEILLLEVGTTFGLAQVTFNSTGYHKELERLRDQAIELGARLVTNSGGGVESAETVRLKNAGDISIMGSIILSVAQAYVKAIITANAFMGGKEVEPTIEMKTELLKPSPDGAVIAGLLASSLRGVIGDEIVVNYYRSVGIIPAEVTDEDIKKGVEDSLTGVNFPDEA